jgi:mRNA interferase MazF
MKRGEIYWANFDPSIGSEIRKRRPAVIVSNNSANKNLDRVQVVPLTSHIKKIYVSETLIIINGKKSKAMADQITTLDKARFGNKISSVSDDEMSEIERIISLQLGLTKMH